MHRQTPLVGTLSRSESVRETRVSFEAVLHAVDFVQRARRNLRNTRAALRNVEEIVAREAVRAENRRVGRFEVVSNRRVRGRVDARSGRRREGESDRVFRVRERCREYAKNGDGEDVTRRFRRNRSRNGGGFLGTVRISEREYGGDLRRR